MGMEVTISSFKKKSSLRTRHCKTCFKNHCVVLRPKKCNSCFFKTRFKFRENYLTKAIFSSNLLSKRIIELILKN